MCRTTALIETKRKAATRAREAAYTESAESLVDKVKNGLSYELPKREKAVLKTNEKPKVVEAVDNPNDKAKIEDWVVKTSLSNENEKQKFDNPLLDTDISWKSKVLGDSKKADGATKERPKSTPYSKSSDYPKAFFTKELFGENKSNNHQFNNVSDEQKRIYEIAEEEGITAAHARIKTYAEQWKDVPEYKWTLGDIAKWKTTGGEKFIHQEKLGFIKNYKDVILDAAEKYDIPPILLAGVAYVEYGGKPMIADDVAYYGRKINKYLPNLVDTTFDKDPKLTSYGNTSIQIRRAAETLGYSSYKDVDMIKILEDPIQNIFVAAAHLNDLRNIDYLGKSADELTEDEIKIIASRYNIGPQYKKESILTQYGEKIYANQDDIMNALQ